MKLDNDTFLHVIENTPLVSIDLIIKNLKGQILLGQRLNRPAKGYWFVPGGRIVKNEIISDAIKRISQTELGITVTLDNTISLGVFDHIYPDSMFGEKEANTHYVVLAKQFILPDEEHNMLEYDKQHSMIKWWDVDVLLKSNDVHDFTKNYFKA